ncbi:hypothetical protein [Streptomyces sp. NPDC088725]|uniref:hypothetical protein n=1 Tax=Streptomyces sp. NPDC088725 TaxID=3365873 RepID=UPI00382F4942
MKLSESRGGTTLGLLLERAGIRMPEDDPDDPNAPEEDRIWSFASREYARQASRKAWVMLSSLRDTWESTEFPALKTNPGISCVFRIAPHRVDRVTDLRKPPRMRG